ncbi:MAG: hypothetical protein HFG49_07715 [Lachnospiraceae bacterium]|jgi:DNA-binding PucR family transcriptional regulator|nr:hypothetical protein [Lachnospiraceae bacterium]
MAVRFREIYEKTHELYKLQILAGKNGMNHVVGWVHMLEDETIVSRFSGQELAVTTGIKAVETDWLLHVVMAMKKNDCTGIIINTGMYIHQIPQNVIDWCQQQDFPLLVMPWEITVTRLIQDYCMKIMRRDQKDKEVGILFKNIMKGREITDAVLSQIQPRFDVQGTFRIFCIRIRYEIEESASFHHALLKLENIFGLWQNGKKIHIPYLIIEFDDFYALLVNNFPGESAEALVQQILKQFSYFTENKKLSLGIGPEVSGIQGLRTAFRRSRIAAKMAFQTKQKVVDFDEMGFFKILFASEDTAILKSYESQMLGPLKEYDERHHSNYLETLRSYIENDRSLMGVAASTYTHRNTVNYRIQNIKKLLNNDLKTLEDLFPYQVAFYIQDMNL